MFHRQQIQYEFLGKKSNKNEAQTQLFYMYYNNGNMLGLEEKR